MGLDQVYLRLRADLSDYQARLRVQPAVLRKLKFLFYQFSMPMHRLLTVLPTAVLCLFALDVAPTLAQEQRITDVSVDSYANDTVGRRLVYEVKEELRDSSAFNLVESSENTIMLLINTMPRNESNPSAATIYSITWVFPSDAAGFPYFLDGKIGHVRSDLIKNHAQDIVASTDGLISDILDMARRAEESLDDEGGRE